MKNIKQLFVCLLAISMTISVSAHAIATDAMESAISPIVITATEFDAISAQTEHVGRIMLPHTNPEGSNGNSCGEFSLPPPLKATMCSSITEQLVVVVSLCISMRRMFP